MFSFLHSNTNKKISARIFAGILPVLALAVFSVFFFSASTPHAEAVHNKRCADNTVQPTSQPCADGSTPDGQPHAEAPPPDSGDTPVPASGSTANTDGMKAFGELIECSVWSPDTYSGCVVELARVVILGVSGLFFFFGGALLDAFMAISLSSTFIKQEGFVDFGWVLIRDIANTAFIFVLLYIAIMTILRAKSTNTKEMLVSLIIAALLVNFSLYITRVVVDASNIVAIEFYQKIGTGGQPVIDVTGITERSISDAFLKVGMASIEEKVFEAFGGVKKEVTKALAVIIAGAIFNVVGFFILLSAAFLFLARAVTLWFVMIFSPLAFVAAILPIGSNIWSKWKSTLFSQSFFAPIFLFFLYLTFAFLDQDVITGGESGTFIVANTGGWINEASAFVVEIFVEVFIPFIVVFAVLSYGLTKAREMAGASGAMAEKFGKLEFGTAVIGGIGLAARTGIGTLRLQDREWYKRAKEKGGFGKLITGATDKIATSSFDLRATGLTKVTGGENLGAAKGAGGAAAAIAKRRQKQAADINSFANDPRRQASIIARLNDADARAYFQTLPVSKQQELIEKAPTQEKGVLRRIRIGLTEGVIGGAGRKEAPHGFLTRLSGEKKAKEDARVSELKTRFAQASAAVGGGVAGAAAQAEFLNTKVSRYDAEKIVRTITPVQQQALQDAAKEEYRPLITRLRTGLPAIPGTASLAERMEEYKKAYGKVGATVDETGKVVRGVAENKIAFIKGLEDMKEEREASAIWRESSPGLRAEMLRKDPSLQKQEDKLSEEDRLKTREEGKKIASREKVRENQKALKTATDAEEKEVALILKSKLNPSQVAELDTDILKKPVVARNLDAAILGKVVAKSDVDQGEFGEIVDHILAGKQASVNTLEAFTKDTSNIKQWLTDAQIEAARKQLAEKRPASTGGEEKKESPGGV